MRCDRCGDNDSGASEFTWIFAKELSRVVTGEQWTSRGRETISRATYGSFHPITVAVCPKCVSQARGRRILPGLLLLAVAVACAGYLVSQIIHQEPGEALGGMFLVSGAGVVLFGLFGLSFAITTAESVAIKIASDKSRGGGFTHRFTEEQYQALTNKS